MCIEHLPAVNAGLNTLAAGLLAAGRYAVRIRRNTLLHRSLMIAALGASAVFLVSYLTYHHIHGVTRYTGQGVLRWLYFGILMTHTPLAAVVPPAALAATWLAVRGRFETHRRIVRWLWPVWMYVSVTGVLIYLMLYVL